MNIDCILVPCVGGEQNTSREQVILLHCLPMPAIQNSPVMSEVVNFFPLSKKAKHIAE